MCNCKLTEIIVGLIILAFAFLETSYSKWVIVIAAAVLLIHALFCRDVICKPKTTAKLRTKKR